jgi:DNA processing protein
LGEAAYPATLATLSDAPPFLWAIGDLDLLTRPIVGMVGTRNASALGLRMARAVARDLGQAGIVTASGLARGIDTAVHHASLSTGTVAVMAGGVDVIYPPENAELAAQIGLRLSEMPMGRAPQARHFPRRNRIISGLSRGIVVIEAALRSGSMITARMAAEQGREVMAVPGHPLDTRASGCNLLLREGAHLIREARDVLVALDLEGAFARAPASAEPPDPTTARVSALSSADLARHLTELELAGEITRSAGGMVARSDHCAADPAAQRHQTAA